MNLSQENLLKRGLKQWRLRKLKAIEDDMTDRQELAIENIKKAGDR